MHILTLIIITSVHPEYFASDRMTYNINDASAPTNEIFCESSLLRSSRIDELKVKMLESHQHSNDMRSGT